MTTADASTTVEPTVAEPVWPWLLAVGAVATLPYLSLVAANVGEGLEPVPVALAWAATVLLALAPVGAFARWRRSAVPTLGVALAVALYLAFGHPGSVWLRDATGLDAERPGWWLLTAAVVTSAAVAARVGAVRAVVRVVAPALLLAPLLGTAAAALAAPEDVTAAPADVPAFARTPDVHWFVLDGLAGVPFLRDEVGVDTAPFVAALEGRGFDVLEDATSNYALTHVAVASALEQELLFEGGDEPPAGPYFRVLRGENRTVDAFLANGYRYVHAYPGLWNGSRCGGREDVCIGRHGTLTETQLALLTISPLPTSVVDDRALEQVAAANDPVAVTRAVLDADTDDPRFAFVHLLTPHPPYLRDAACELRDVPLDLAAWGDGPEYRDAVTCLFARLEEAVDALLEDSPDALVVITGDHGPRFGLDGDTTGEVVLDDEMHHSAFSALRLPSACDDLGVPEDLSLVNTLRVVTACLADVPLELVDDELLPIVRSYD